MLFLYTELFIVGLCLMRSRHKKKVKINISRRKIIWPNENFKIFYSWHGVGHGVKRVVEAEKHREGERVEK